MQKRLGVIVLAAGFSSRMGAFKPLLPFGETTVAEHLIRNLRSIGLSEIYVVTGFRADELAGRMAASGAVPIHNPRFEEGMFSSIQAGIQSLPRDLDGFFVLPVDTPLVRPGTFHFLANVLDASNRKGIFIPRFSGRRGHPPLLDAGWAEAILQWQGPYGLRGFFQAHSGSCVEVDVPDRLMLLDMDTPEKYRTLLEALPRQDIPDREECLALLRTLNTPPEELRRIQEASSLASFLGHTLTACGNPVDLQRLEAAALLQHLKPAASKHSESLAAFLKGIGFGRVAETLAAAAHIDPLSTGPQEEADILLLADSHLRRGAAPGSAASSVGTPPSSFGEHGGPEADRRRIDRVQALEKRFEETCGKTISCALQEYREHDDRRRSHGVTAG
ncbi:nucleotidyltransferase family protein [Desulfatiglans anilini]|uniref:nucleotidyltransferase family protein n=1 Tax=Desulfatiglans anilini TaxID=90728 RepID=UPI000403117B|nr:nucleotidyltransferase family protein [Desulfatiglans anilini]